MKIRLSAMLAGSSLLVIASALSAQAQQSVPSKRADLSVVNEEIVVTARRKEENLQDVPESVNVVTSEALTKYNLLDFKEITKLVPGLSLSGGNGVGNGVSTDSSMRGITYNGNQNLSIKTVTFYLNDGLVNDNFLFQSMFDVGQIEVLRGPQGTMRGAISTSGSLTVTSRRPDLDQIGGTVQATVGDHHNTNLQAAVGVPIVEDKFAIRIAALRDETDNGGVHSVNSSVRPDKYTEAMRITGRLQPTDNISAVLTYEHLWNKYTLFDPVYGSGSPGGVVAGAGRGYNGPVITQDQSLSVSPQPSAGRSRYDTAQAQIDMTIAGQKLSYVGAISTSRQYTTGSIDTGNLVLGQLNSILAVPDDSTLKEWQQEVRLSSVDRLFGHFDYNVGFFYHYFSTPLTTIGAPRFLSPTAFGTPVGIRTPTNASLLLFNPTSLGPNIQESTAGFGTLTFHFDDKTEISAGIRYSAEYHDSVTTLSFVPAIRPPSVLGNDVHTDKPVLYNVEISHHFNPDMMVYARTGSSYRPGAFQIGLAATAQGPGLAPYFNPRAEKSKTYEVGVKADFFDKHLLIDADYYHQNYKDFIYTVPSAIYYLNVPQVGAQTVNTSSLFTTNADAKVDGIELTADAKITPEWSASGALSWSNGRLSGTVPCNPTSAIPTVATFTSAGAVVFTCPSNAATTTQPKWNFNIQSEYARPITDELTGFIRGLLDYFPANPNAGNGYVVPSYATVDMYVGVRGPQSKWELSAYGKNITNNQTITRLGVTDLGGNGTLGTIFGPTGYFSIAHIRDREFGLIARYAFGSR